MDQPGERERQCGARKGSCKKAGRRFLNSTNESFWFRISVNPDVVVGSTQVTRARLLGALARQALVAEAELHPNRVWSIAVDQDRIPICRSI